MRVGSRHIPFDRLIDRVEGRLSPDEQTQMQAHTSACSRCATQLAWLERVIGLMRTNDYEEPPARVAADISRVFFSYSRSPASALRQRIMAVLHFDSMQLRQPVGVRSGQPAERQLLFTAGELSIDLRIVPSGALWSLVGQVLGPSTGAGQVVLASQADTAEAVLNELSEFTLPPVPAGDYTLTLRLTGIEVEVGRLQLGS